MMEAANETQVGVILVKGGCCGGNASDDAMAGARFLIEKISAESAVPILIREIGGSQAMQGGLPSHLLAQGLKIYDRLGKSMIPAIIIDGEWVSFGIPNEGELKEALLGAWQRLSDNERGESL